MLKTKPKATIKPKEKKPRKPPKSEASHLNLVYVALLLKDGPMSIAELKVATGLSFDQISSVLQSLESSDDEDKAMVKREKGKWILLEPED